MTEKERLLHTLFEQESREHLNLKFCRGHSDGISPEGLCREANSAIFQLDAGIAEPNNTFGDKDRKVVDVRPLFA